MARFETVYITRPDLDDDARKAILEKLKNLVGERKGQVHVEQDWGKQKLAYEIKKQIKGYYTYVGFEGTGELLRELERVLRLNESVIKFQSISVEGEFEPTLTQMDRTRPAPSGRGRGRSDAPFGRSFDDDEGEGMGGGMSGGMGGKRDDAFDAAPVAAAGFDDDAEMADDKGSNS